MCWGQHFFFGASFLWGRWPSCPCYFCITARGGQLPIARVASACYTYSTGYCAWCCSHWRPSLWCFKFISIDCLYTRKGKHFRSVFTDPQEKMMELAVDRNSSWSIYTAKQRRMQNEGKKKAEPLVTKEDWKEFHGLFPACCQDAKRASKGRLYGLQKKKPPSQYKASMKLVRGRKISVFLFYQISFTGFLSCSLLFSYLFVFVVSLI